MNTEFIPDKKFMLKCFELAEIASAEGEVPVGAVVELNGEIIGYGYNKRETNNSPTAHAEILAIEMAAKHINSWRLTNANLYVSLEPCPMCTGAIINARINRVIFAAHDDRAGCMGSICDLTKLNFNHKPLIYRGFMELEATNMLKNFFKNLRTLK